MEAGQGCERGWNSSWHSHLLPLAQITYLYVENHFLILPGEGRGGKRRAFIPCHSERTLKTYLLCCFLQGVCYRVLISATIYWLLEEEKILPEPGSSFLFSTLNFTSSYIVLFPLSVCNVKTYMLIHTQGKKISKSYRYLCLKNRNSGRWPWSC